MAGRRPRLNRGLLAAKALRSSLSAEWTQMPDDSAAPDQTLDVFFYGLFMDPEALRARGLNPHKPRLASVPAMALRIGARATLEQDEASTVHGIVMTLSAGDLAKLYAEPGLAAYKPEAVSAVGSDGVQIQAVTYLLPGKTAGPFNADYAGRLAKLASRLGLPTAYVRQIEALER